MKLKIIGFLMMIAATLMGLYELLKSVAENHGLYPVLIISMLIGGLAILGLSDFYEDIKRKHK